MATLVYKILCNAHPTYFYSFLSIYGRYRTKYSRPDKRFFGHTLAFDAFFTKVIVGIHFQYSYIRCFGLVVVTDSPINKEDLVQPKQSVSDN